jgi:hypothetical protein
MRGGRPGRDGARRPERRDGRRLWEHMIHATPAEVPVPGLLYDTKHFSYIPRDLCGVPHMTALTEIFFDTVYFPRNGWAVVRWWETRRPVYNAAVGGTGLVTLATLALLNALPPLGVTAQIALVYGLVANVCYSLGPLFDLLARRLGGPDYAPVGPTLFRYGFVFSIGLTLFPVMIAGLWWAVRLVLWLRGVMG